MHTWFRSSILIAAGIILSVVPVWGDVSAHLDDPVGDTVDSDTAAALQVPQADIVRSSILYAADGITLNVQVRSPTAPLTDKSWDGDTDIQWSLDTTGDGQPDFDAEYYTEAKKITGDVSRSSDNDNEPDLCKVKSAIFNADAGYTAVIDPACIGAPATIAYAAEFTYDTNSDDDNAPDAEDDAPDTGMSPQVSLAPRAPAAAPSTEQPAPTTGSPANMPPPEPVQAPTGAPAAAPASPGKAPSPGSATSASPAPARRVDQAGNPAAATGAAPESAGRNLAEAGAASRLLVALAGAVLALGGLCVMGGAWRGRTTLV